MGVEYNRTREAERMRAARASAMDIGGIPEVVDPERRRSCERDLRLFCEVYRPEVFNMEWSDDHLKAIDTLERQILGTHTSPLFALAMPRGQGKTTLTVTAAIWALIYGHRRWVCLVGATSGKAEALLKSIKTVLRFEPTIVADFPEVCTPIAKLEGRASRAAGQKINGQETNISWLSDKLIFPTVEGSISSGSVVSVCGITGDIRGQQETTVEGEIIRPDFVIIDDPQTRESAASEKQCEDRIATIMGDILGLGGPGVDISCAMPCTVIKKYDVADRMLGDEFPEWVSIRSQMLYGEPKNPGLIDQYLDIRDNCIRNDLGLDEANAFWRENQEEIEEGMTPSWAARFKESEVSAIQHAINLKARDELAFLSEYQNQPPDDSGTALLSFDEIIQKQGDYKENEVPEEARHLVAFADVQQEALYWVVMAFDDKFNGWIVSYGTTPEQKDRNLTYRNLRLKLSKVYGGSNLETKIRGALEDLTERLLSRDWTKPSGDTLRIEKMLVDANWGQSRDIIYNWIRQSNWKAVLFPSHGKYVGASTQPLNEGQARKAGKVIGIHWRSMMSKEMPQRYVLYDTNHWKSFFWERFKVESGSKGCFYLFKQPAMLHQQLALNLRSEYPVTTEGRGRTVEEWKLKPGEDNHYFDCAVGCCVAASMAGVRITGQITTPVIKPRTMRKVKRGKLL